MPNESLLSLQKTQEMGPNVLKENIRIGALVSLKEVSELEFQFKGHRNQGTGKFKGSR